MNWRLFPCSHSPVKPNDQPERSRYNFTSRCSLMISPLFRIKSAAPDRVSIATGANGSHIKRVVKMRLAPAIRKKHAKKPSRYATEVLLSYQLLRAKIDSAETVGTYSNASQYI